MKITYEYDKLNSVSFFGRSYFMMRGNKIHSNSVPINDFYWVRFESIDDKAIAMHNIRFVNYCENYNNSIKPFKKGY